ncbi:histidinol-phosphate transaminase [Alkalihalobacillus sp. AL-G]|uniref:histidinol-phosphate transaminase n=1 Tax=Alkalihalobacillus sp. AL-G TaxID=2926399 RepID=UPI0027295DC7|nr:histidinol-phosphate transaminase [Alkalihalobacillus sp. AL-G]WLD93410.1 histidinol-phosphate transaminase [Alkalihalobacillus sp. AL-G]
MKVKKQLLSLKAYDPGKPMSEVKKEYGLPKIVNLASNENPFGCSQSVSDALNSFSHYSRYPEGNAPLLREKVADRLGVKQKQLLFSTGLDEMIQMISRALLSPKTNVVMASMTFPQFRHHAVIEQAEIRQVPLIDGRHDLEGMQQVVDEQTSIVWICNPNNPTGTYVNETELSNFMEHIPKDTLVALDEAYYEYVTANDYPDTLKLMNDYENLLVLRTFSKAYGLAAFRVGYAIGHEALIEKLDIARLPFNTSSLGQIAAQAAIADEEFIQMSSYVNKMCLQQFYAFCNEYKVDYYPSQGNFIYIKLKKSVDEVFQYLMERGYIVRPMKDGIRVTVGTEEDNEGLISLLKQMFIEDASRLRLLS